MVYRNMCIEFGLKTLGSKLDTPPKVVENYLAKVLPVCTNCRYVTSVDILNTASHTLPAICCHPDTVVTMNDGSSALWELCKVKHLHQITTQCLTCNGLSKTGDNDKLLKFIWC